MTLFSRVRVSLAAAAIGLMTATLPASAQEISESHLKAARAAIDSINATDPYDIILPQAAVALKEQLISKNPDLTDKISELIDQKALELAGRRADLEKEAALAYARVFSEADLNAIATFYNTPAGLKLLSDGPIVTREVSKAAEIWQNGLARDLAEQVGEALKAAVAEQAQNAPAPEGAAPAEGAPAEEAAPAEGETAPANPN